MPGMDIFNNSAFSMTSLTGTVEKMQYVPQTLGQLNIFEPMPVRTRNLFVDRRASTLSLIATSALGAPPKAQSGDDRDGVSLRTVRLAKSFTLFAHEIEGIRAFGSMTELMQVQAEYLRRMARLRNDMDLTHEYHRLGALQGIVLDADGVTVLHDSFEVFGVTAPTPIEFAFSVATTNVRQICNNLTRSMIRGSGGALTDSVQIHALCGDAFYDGLTMHPTVEKTYLNWAAAADLREGNAFRSFTYGGITWHNYRGTDDNSTVAIDSDEAKFFPVGATDVFKKAMAPAEFGPYIGTLGQDVYAMNIVDRDRAAFTQGELYSYPLYFCQRPDLLRSGVRT